MSNKPSNETGVVLPCEFTDTVSFYSYENKDTLWQDNNKFGLYVYAENKEFFELAQNLVNSNGGEWGYVLIPFNVKDTDYAKWERVFDQLNEKKLIPIIQLWDVDTHNYIEQTRDAALFLNSFLWPIKYRYISAYNEPNARDFWYDSIDPKEYALILDYTIRSFKELNTDFFILNGAFNVSAASGPDYMDSFVFMKEMNNEIPGIFERLDGWASHPYPQPNFSGDPLDTGRWSIKAYQSELDYLKNTLGVKKDLPVFITETGWAHAEGDSYNNSYYGVDTVSDYFKSAFNDVWLKDPKVRAVTPFTIRYDPPFDHFSWVNKDNVPYKHFDVVKAIKKVKGLPPILQRNNVEINGCSK